MIELPSCKNCNYYKNGYCTHTTPPTKILSEYLAQICDHYTVEEAITYIKTEPVTIQGTKGIEGKVAYGSNVTVPHGTTGIAVLNISGKHIVLESFEWCTNYNEMNMGFTIRNKIGDSVTLRCLDDNPSVDWASQVMSPLSIHSFGSDIFEEEEYDEASNHFKYRLRTGKKLSLPNGCSIKFVQLSGLDKLVAYQIAYSILGE